MAAVYTNMPRDARSLHWIMLQTPPATYKAVHTYKDRTHCEDYIDTEQLLPELQGVYICRVAASSFAIDGGARGRHLTTLSFHRPASQELQANKKYLQQHNAGFGPNGTANPLSGGVLGTQNGNGVGVNNQRFVYLDKSFPINPVAGLHVVRINRGASAVLLPDLQACVWQAPVVDYHPSHHTWRHALIRHTSRRKRV